MDPLYVSCAAAAAAAHPHRATYGPPRGALRCPMTDDTLPSTTRTATTRACSSRTPGARSPIRRPTSSRYLEPGITLLDVGCGPGTITAEFAERLAPGRVVGLDASAEVIEKAEQLGSPAEFVVGDAYALPFDDATLRHRARPPDPPAPRRPGAGPARVAPSRQARRHRRGPRRRLRRHVLVAATAGPDAWLDLYERVHRSNGGEPDAGRRLKSLGARRRLRGCRGHRHRSGTSTTPPTGSGGASMWERRVLDSAFATDALAKGLATQSELDAISRGLACLGGRSARGGSRCRTGRSSPDPEPRHPANARVAAKERLQRSHCKEVLAKNSLQCYLCMHGHHTRREAGPHRTASSTSTASRGSRTRCGCRSSIGCRCTARRPRAGSARHSASRAVRPATTCASSRSTASCARSRAAAPVASAGGSALRAASR